MRELKEDTFSGNKDEDAHDHIDSVLSIVGLFNILGGSKNLNKQRKKTPMINYLRRNLIQDILRFPAPSVKDSIWSERYSEWCNENYHDEKPRPRDYTIKEWVKLKKGHPDIKDEEKIELGSEDYNPPMVHTFEVTKYKFDNGCSFICVNGENNETPSLGRKNGSRFRKMIMEQMEEVLGNDGEDSDDKT
ncbi:hypothetical protein Tco_1166586 [Tanacetum coccineum]